jgi:hypothetical protein
MAAHQEPPGGEHGRAVADRVPIFSLFGAEVISSVGTTSPCWRCLVRLVTTGSPVRTGLTGAAMGSGRPWRRCSAGRSWIGWASQRAAPDRGDHRHQRDDSTTFGAVLKDVPPIRTPSTTLARRGTRGSRRSRRMVVTQFGHDAGQGRGAVRAAGGGPGGLAAPGCPPSAWPPVAPPAASHACRASPQ